jgi:uncharacterized protein YdhG (YjbR/CyaY superfamily)
MGGRRLEPDPEAVTAHIEAAAETARTGLRALGDIIRAEAHEAVEPIAFGLATWHQGENLVHLGAFARHVGARGGRDGGIRQRARSVQDEVSSRCWLMSIHPDVGERRIV